MASLTSIRTEIGNNLGNISSLSVYAYVPDFVEPPSFLREYETQVKQYDRFI